MGNFGIDFCFFSVNGWSQLTYFTFDGTLRKGDTGLFQVDPPARGRVFPSLFLQNVFQGHALPIPVMI